MDTAIQRGAEFGGLLVALRRSRRMSQLTLALEAGVSSRHLSFVETGRSRPSREMVLRLCGALDLPLRERNDLLVAAGFAPMIRETPLEAPEMAGMLEALSVILGQHDPFGAVALDRNWDIVMASRTYASLVNAHRSDSNHPIEALVLTKRPRPNLLRLLCRPDGYRRSLLNWKEVAAAVLARVDREIARDPPASPRRGLLAEVLAHPEVPAPQPYPDGALVPPLVVPVEVVAADGKIHRLLSTIATLGTAEDITLRELRIEAFYPAGDLVE